ncbi:MAG: metallophosphoesterase family protein [Helicobacter sp.]|nr:metallophosphoesterase family protein [Helicobacter sp.]
MNGFCHAPTPETFIISDPHFGHNKIFIKEPKRLLGEEKPKQAFKKLCKNWNALVGKKDNILCLGDMFGVSGSRYIHKLKGKKSLILGNHDIKPHNKELLYSSDFAILHGIALQIPSGEEIAIEATKRHNTLSGYEQECLSVLVCDVLGLRVMFCHYPLFERHPSDERFFALFALLEWLFEQCHCDVVIHGHIHSHNASDLRCINACIDVTNYAPIRLTTLLEQVQKGK